MLELNNITKIFNSKGIAGLNNINLKLKKGEILSVMGPNGSGKTTLLNIISGKIKPDSGEMKPITSIVFFNSFLEETDANVQQFLQSKITGTVDEDKKIQLARDMADIFEFTFQLKQNLNQLSAGQKQKVALASVLINNPGVLLLDEPFSHLDPFTRKDILKYLFEVISRNNTTVLWVTHDIQDAMAFSSKIMLMNFGKIEQMGKPEDFVSNPKNLFVAKYFGYLNFLPFKLEESVFNSPWGPIQLKTNLENGYLVIPTYSWELTSDVPEAKVKSTTPQGHFHLIEIELQERSFYVIHKNSWPKVRTKDSLTLRPVFDECLTIPL